MIQGFVSLLKGFSCIKEMDQVHALITKTGLKERNSVACRMVSFCVVSVSRNLNYAFLVFEELAKPYIAEGHNFVLLHKGAKVHCTIIQTTLELDPFVHNSLISMYSKSAKNIESANGLLKKMPIRIVVSWNTMIAAHVDSDDIKTAQMVFEEMPERDTASWNAIIVYYVKKKSYNQALELFDKTQDANVSPTEITLITLVGACAELGAMEMGKKLHEYIEKNVEDENEACDFMEWNAMILGFAVHGHCKEAIELFARMQSSGTNPDSVTFLAVLTTCSYSGLVDEGLLEEAHDVINKKSFEANTIIWRTLLGASRTHGNVGLVEVALENLGRLEPLKYGDYVLLSNIYLEAHTWDDIERVRKMMVKMGVLKTLGCSHIEING
ncbi:hypothetical protein AMTRI_Chr09g36320 [Amborella trichopoda]